MNITQDSVRYKGFYQFQPEDWIMHYLLKQENCLVLGPFPSQCLRLRLLLSRADFFITGENRSPEFHRAKKQIGFWRSYKDRDDVFRFPNWMWHLDYPELNNQPPYPRYGKRLEIDRLMRPISESYSHAQIYSRLNRAVLFSKHLREPRHRFFQLTNNSIGCDGFGEAFGVDNRNQPKMPIMEKYRYSLCPENSIGDGYITEKIPEAFHSGCIPITWCRPEDLVEDFNPMAVVNLFGLDAKQCNELLTELRGEGEFYWTLISEPLLLKKPELNGLIHFIQS